MFYPEKIKNIKDTDKVLEIGPGDSPFHRSDVLLELAYQNEEERIKQFGHANPLLSNKQIVYYDGNKFPFEDKAFDYVICSHVLEHVPDVALFLSEIFRVAKRGYFEYPLVTYDYLYNFDVHLNFLKFKDGTLSWMKKNETSLSTFKPLQDFFRTTLENNYGDFLGGVPQCFFEGFEWEKEFTISHSSDLNAYIEPFPKASGIKPSHETSIKQASKLLFNAIKNRIKR